MPRVTALLAALVATTVLTIAPSVAPAAASTSSATTGSAASPASAPSTHATSWFAAPDGRAIVVTDGVVAARGKTLPLNRPVVGIAPTPSGAGYWLVASDGGIFSFGDARFFGSTGGMRLNQPIVGIAGTPSGHGYWLVARDGGIFAFGDARFFGSTGAMRLNQPVVGIAASPTGSGYALVASDGGIFSFGDFRFAGSTGGMRLNQPVVGIAATRSGRGYWMVAADGGIFSFGDARFLGSAVGAPSRTVAMSSDGNGGYAVIRADGTTSSFRVPGGFDAASTTDAIVTPSTPVVPSSSGVKVGAYVGPAQASKIATFASNAQADVTVAVDFLDMTKDWSQVASPNWVLDGWTPWLKADASRTLVLSVPMLISSAKGQFDNTAFDSYHRQLAQNIADRGIASQVIIRLGWEMNGTWFPWSTSADGFKRMWRRLIPMYRAVSSDLTFDWCVSGGSPNPEAWYPGDDVVDVVGMDQYDIMWQHPGGDPAQRWAFIQPNYQWHADFAAAHAKPAAIDEWALWTSNDATQGGGGDNPTFISNVAAWSASHRYLHVAYFNVTSGGPDTTLEQNPASLAAFRTSF